MDCCFPWEKALSLCSRPGGGDSGTLLSERHPCFMSRTLGGSRRAYSLLESLYPMNVGWVRKGAPALSVTLVCSLASFIWSFCSCPSFLSFWYSHYTYVTPFVVVLCILFFFRLFTLHSSVLEFSLDISSCLEIFWSAVSSLLLSQSKTFFLCFSVFDL